MKDSVCIDINSSISKDDLLKYVAIQLPDYKWRGGDSDMIGPYVSGINDKNISIEFWFGEEPLRIGISFVNFKNNLPEREIEKETFLDSFLANVASFMGEVIKLDT